jgi:hypothetical protein
LPTFALLRAEQSVSIIACDLNKQTNKQTPHALPDVPVCTLKIASEATFGNNRKFISSSHLGALLILDLLPEAFIESKIVLALSDAQRCVEMLHRRKQLPMNGVFLSCSWTVLGQTFCRIVTKCDKT